jgi:PIN domain nuclease of toxin-antitoxin system
MRLLLDTHTILWSVDSPSRLSEKARAAIQSPQNELICSAGSIWELAIKVGLNKLTLSLPFRQWMVRAIDDLNLTVLPVTVDYADLLTTLPPHHGDPFDRLLIAQAMVERIPVVSADRGFDAYPISRLW